MPSPRVVGQYVDELLNAVGVCTVAAPIQRRSCGRDSLQEVAAGIGLGEAARRLLARMYGSGGRLQLL